MNMVYETRILMGNDTIRAAKMLYGISRNRNKLVETYVDHRRQIGQFSQKTKKTQVIYIDFIQ